MRNMNALISLPDKMLRFLGWFNNGIEVSHKEITINQRSHQGWTKKIAYRDYATILQGITITMCKFLVKL